MPKKKTGARKKKEKQAERQKGIRSARSSNRMDLSRSPCNIEIECNECGRRQKNRAFCCFCQAVQRVIICVECGKSKCSGGDCLPGCKHTAAATGMAYAGAICDFCEGFVCHSKACIVAHSCPCPLEGAVCAECSRDITENGGRFFKCSMCDLWLCGDDAFEHQASCQFVDNDNLKCVSCGRNGMYTCLRCKVSVCDVHASRKGVKLSKGEIPPCKKCGFKLKETKDLSVSARTIEYGRHHYDSGSDSDSGGGGGDYAAYAAFMSGGSGGGDSGDGGFSYGGYSGYGGGGSDSDDDDDEE